MKNTKEFDSINWRNLGLIVASFFFFVGIALLVGINNEARDPVVSKFDFSGNPVSSMSKTYYMWLMGGTFIFCNVIFAGIGIWFKTIPLKWINVPYKTEWTATPELTRELRFRLRGLMIITAAFTNSILAICNFVIYKYNGGSLGPNINHNFLIYGMLLGTPLFVIVMFWYSKPVLRKP